MVLSNAEKETIILFDEDTEVASVYTFCLRLKRKLEKLHNERPDECRYISCDDDGGVTYEFPKKWVKINAGMSLSQEQKEARAARLRQNKLKTQ